jgi:galacturonokinase
MTSEELIAALRAEVRSAFAVEAGCVRVVKSPYRICPLGAHIDHQLGTVTAMAIDRAVHLAYAPSGSDEVRLRSRNFPGEVRFNLPSIPPKSPGDWGNYARGAARALQATGPLEQGIVGVTHGDWAEGGLSSSASVGLAYLLALADTNQRAISRGEWVRLDQAIEKDYLGLNNGILDQSAILFSRQDHLTRIDCKAFAEATLATQPHDPPPGITLAPPGAAMPPFVILLAFSGLTQPIVATNYNLRVAECAAAARALLHAAGRPQAPSLLGHVRDDEYRAFGSVLSGPPARRAAHFFGEMGRVRDGLAAWQRGDLPLFGRLMTESGRSSITNYECGGPPLIDLYELLVRTPGIFGARFSGAGFRGCCVAWAEPEAAQAAAPAILRAYTARHPALAARARVFWSRSADGIRWV